MILLQGRALFALKLFQKDEAILEELPLVSSQFSWNAEYRYLTCEFCMKYVINIAHYEGVSHGVNKNTNKFLFDLNAMTGHWNQPKRTFVAWAVVKRAQLNFHIPNAVRC